MKQRHGWTRRSSQLAKNAFDNSWMTMSSSPHFVINSTTLCAGPRTHSVPKQNRRCHIFPNRSMHLRISTASFPIPTFPSRLILSQVAKKCVWTHKATAVCVPIPTAKCASRFSICSGANGRNIATASAWSSTVTCKPRLHSRKRATTTAYLNVNCSKTTSRQRCITRWLKK